VEKDEVDVPYLVMGANGEDNVTLRFRGTKDGPKTLTPQYLTSGSGNHTIVNVQGGTYASGTTPGFITIGNQSLEKTKTFILGSNIKIQGHTRGTEHTNNYGYIFYLWDYGTLIMEPGAAIDGFKDTSGYIANTYNKLSYVRIEGGSITNCETYLTSGTYRGMIRFGSRGENQPSGVFYVAGGNALTVENCNPGVSKLVTFGNSEPHNVDLALGASLP
jgi:hypothetical protein